MTESWQTVTHSSVYVSWCQEAFTGFTADTRDASYVATSHFSSTITSHHLLLHVTGDVTATAVIHDGVGLGWTCCSVCAREERRNRTRRLTWQKQNTQMTGRRCIFSTHEPCYMTEMGNRELHRDCPYSNMTSDLYVHILLSDRLNWHCTGGGTKKSPAELVTYMGTRPPRKKVCHYILHTGPLKAARSVEAELRSIQGAGEELADIKSEPREPKGIHGGWQGEQIHRTDGTQTEGQWLDAVWISRKPRRLHFVLDTWSD